ncbi:MAG: ThuA domain-containing protein [Kiritimatiellae bacterium]|nr:ThuA domain-containing protein [Kiritimatiellia bacterium]
MADKIRVTVWNENVHEKTHEEVRKMYPLGIHGAIAQYLAKQPDLEVRTATLDEPEHGLTESVLVETDVLTWWGHIAHGKVDDKVVARVQKRVLAGMGLIVLHSGHLSKIFRALMGTTGSLKWGAADEKERLWNLEPGHPITAGIGACIELPYEEMYGERFDIPTPDKLIFVSWFEGGAVFRSGCCWERGHGRIFYFQPGHETYPSLHNPEILRVITNAVRWARQRICIESTCVEVKPLEKISAKQM